MVTFVLFYVYSYVQFCDTVLNFEGNKTDICTRMHVCMRTTVPHKRTRLMPSFRSLFLREFPGSESIGKDLFM